MPKQKNDLIEIIYQSENKIKNRIFLDSNHEVKEATQLLKIQAKDIKLFLDFHGVADLFSSYEKIYDSPICVISYMRPNSSFREKVRMELTDRIKQKQILYGILVFKRTEEPNIIGTKAWILKNSVIQRSCFIDDSIDHIKSINATNIINLTAFEIKKKDQKNKQIIIELIKNFFDEKN